ncbi:MAG: PAS domain S-box protein [Rhodospirillales bacterium]|nr:PAS domain S-box protein [Rhodospirillales bacterium]
MVHADRKLIFVNPAAVRLMGAGSAEELIGKPSMDVVAPEQRDHALKRIEHVESTGVPAPPTEFKYQRLDGSLVDVETIGTMITFEGQRARLVITQDISDRKRSENILQDTIESIPDGIAYYDADDRLALFNENFVKGREELKNILKLNMTFEEQARIREESGLRDKYLKHKKFSIEERLKRHLNPGKPHIEYRPDGRIIQSRETKTPNGGIAIIRTDVTDYQAALEKVTASENQFRAFMDTVPSAVNLKDTEGRFLVVNKIWREWFAPNDEDVLGKTVEELFPTEYATRVRATDSEVLTTGKMIEQEMQTPLQDGTARTTILQKFPVRDAGGEISGIGTINTDISERQKARDALQNAHDKLETRVQERTENLNQQIVEREQIEVALREQQDRLQGILDTVVDGIITITERGHIDSFNKAAESIFGYEADEVIGKNIKILMPNPHQENHDQYLKNYKKSGERKIIGISREVVGLKKDGSTFPMFLAVSELKQEGQNLFTGLVRDITDRKQAEDDLKFAKQIAEEANRAKSEFLSSMSHELRTPLNAVLGFSQLLKTNPNETLSEGQVSAVEHIEKGGHHLLTLINDVLDLAKIESGTVELSIESLEVATLVEECFSLLETNADETGIQLNNRCMPLGNKAIRGDSTRLKQVLLNLLSNGIKYNRDGGEVTLTCSEAGAEMLRINVTDTGMGIPQEQHQELFQPFSRLGQEMTEIEGTGIGLVVTKRLVNEMGGNIGFVSDVGEGSTFWIEIPLSSDVASQEADDTSAELSPAFDEAVGQVLYIEDNPANLTLMEMIIARTKGLKMITAHTAELGLDLAKAKKPDIVIMDINLPGMNGIKALERLREMKETREIPVIALTANATARDIKMGEAAGFHAYLTKPVDVSTLLDSIQLALD